MSLYELRGDPPLVEPVLVLGMEGWIDAGMAGANAAAAVVAALEPEPLAVFDTDVLLDHRSRRPLLEVVDGMNAGLSWPSIQLRYGRLEGRDVVALVGPEPDHQWQGFTRSVVGLSRELGVRLVCGLGAFPAPVPHTRPVRLASTATTEALAAQVGFVGGSITVPAGIHAALEEGFAGAGVPAVGLWARIPHYVAAMAYPAGSVALLGGLAQVGGVHVDTAELMISASETGARIDELVASNPEHLTMVRALEAQVDAEDHQGGFGEIPSGDEIAAELERFLRNQD